MVAVRGLACAVLARRRVAEVVVELTRHQQQVGRPPPGAGAAGDDVRRVVAEGLSYLGHNAARMDYPRFLPASGSADDNSLVESLVEDFRTPGQEQAVLEIAPAVPRAILQVRAAYPDEGWPAAAATSPSSSSTTAGGSPDRRLHPQRCSWPRAGVGLAE